MSEYGLESREAVVKNRSLETETVVVEYGDAGSAITVAEFKEGDIVMEVLLDVKTAFDGSGTDLIEVGDGSTSNKYLAQTDVSGTGGTVGSQETTPLVPAVHETADGHIEVLYTDANSDAAAGKAYVTVVIARVVLP